MSIPLATARLQLHAGYTLRDAREQVPYFARLGISHLYTSPLTRSRKGSSHGYDVVDHGEVDPELGGIEALRELAARLREHGMGLIADIVPNHMATSAENEWWWTVLRNGRDSPHARWFDIDWNPPDEALRGKVLLPFLAQQYGSALNAGEIALRFDQENGNFYVEAHGAHYPVAPGSVRPPHAGTIPDLLAAHDAAQPAGRLRLHRLLERQHYRLAWWRCAPETINWRRFFEITDLIGVRVELPEVFDAVHARVLALYEEGLIDGVRIDHIDGLADPLGYCRRLRRCLEARAPRRPGALAGDTPYIVVEKILGRDETLDPRWPVHGTTGYDFMSDACAVLHSPDGEAPLTRLWTQVAGDSAPFAAVVERSRRLMLERHFPAEHRAAANALLRVARADPATRDWGEHAIRRALLELLAGFPVYRTYIDEDGCGPADTAVFETALSAAHDRLHDQHDGDDVALLYQVHAWLGGESGGARQEECQDARRFALRKFQQLTPALAAKAVEDTSFYRYSRLLSRNEVGADPGMLALAAEDFLRRCASRPAHAMLATATHDHKRGEDVRARLAVLTEVADEWSESVRKWLQEDERRVPEPELPAAPDRYALYQCLVGAWPLDLEPEDAGGVRAYVERVAAWQEKALREAKLRTSWFTPYLGYERACRMFLDAVMQAGGLERLPEIAAWARRLAPAGAVNGLAQTVLRLGAPGVPDLYQGTEFWDFSLVDPDNRRPVDYAARDAALQELDDDTPAQALLADWRSGRIKQAVLRRGLALRRERPELFGRGALLALPVRGPHAHRVLAFERRLDEDSVIVVVPRYCSDWIRQAELSAGPAAAGNRQGLPLPDPARWRETSVTLPECRARRPLFDVLSRRDRQAGPDGELALAHVLEDLPVALLASR